MCFGDVLTAMVTPFHEDGSVNYEKAQELALHLLDHGSDGILICGTTGESSTVTPAEAETLMMQVHRNNSAVVGIYSYDIARSKVQKATRMARDEGFPLRLTVTPEEE